MRWTIIVLNLFLMCITQVYSTSLIKVKIKDISSSGKSLLLFRGEFEGLSNGDKGEFYLDTARKFSLGIGEVVKTHAKYSYWFFKKSVVGGILKSKDTIYYESKDKVRYNGRPQEYSHRIFDIYSD